MRVLHINQSDTHGGAAIAGYRLHQGLLQQGIDSQLLVGRKQTESEQVFQIPSVSARELKLQRVTRRMGLNHIHQLSTFNLAHHPAYQAADVLNFHNIHTGYFNYLAIPKLSKTKAAVVTLHDMWWFTGHCAYSYGCDRWIVGCGHCPDLNLYPAIRRDSTRWEWQLKNWVYQHANPTFIAPSRWLAQLAQQSLLKCYTIQHIPNGVDLEIFQPLDRKQCRIELNLPLDKNVLLFVSHTLKDSRKGGDVLVSALQALPESLKKDTILLTLGEVDPTLAQTVGIETVNLGYVKEDARKAIAYSASDLFVFPTRADNLPLVLQESMACGTPMVSFDIGGVPDLVRPNLTGYLAEPGNAADLSAGIVKLLEDLELREKMQSACREIARAEYSLDLQAQRYADLYLQLLHHS